MSTEALLLALTAIVRPTSMAAVVAILSTPKPQRLLVAYVLAGLAFSLAIGVLVVLLVQGLASPSAAATGRPVVDIVLGAIALIYAGAVWAGALPRPRTESAPSSPTWMRRRLHDLTPSGAATAGVLTHLPGLVYLAALNAIVGSARGALDAVLQVVVYNAIWFSVAITALVLSVYRPSVPRRTLEQLAAWTRQHRRVLMGVVLGVLGVYLLLTGILDLAPPGVTGPGGPGS